MRLESGERFEWVKPIMLSGGRCESLAVTAVSLGLGQMDHGHLVKEEPQVGP